MAFDCKSHLPETVITGDYIKLATTRQISLEPLEGHLYLTHIKVFGYNLEALQQGNPPGDSVAIAVNRLGVPYVVNKAGYIYYNPKDTASGKSTHQWLPLNSGLASDLAYDANDNGYYVAKVESGEGDLYKWDTALSVFTKVGQTAIRVAAYGSEVAFLT